MDKKWEAMDALFKPKAVAVIGASDNPGKLGSHVMRSLIEEIPRKIFPVTRQERDPGDQDLPFSSSDS
jgi:acyl-CoA synthetase (NDP forming)